MKRIVHDITALRGVTDVYCYFNNDIQVEAIRNARELASMVRS